MAHGTPPTFLLFPLPSQESALLRGFISSAAGVFPTLSGEPWSTRRAGRDIGTAIVLPLRNKPSFHPLQRHEMHDLSQIEQPMTSSRTATAVVPAAVHLREAFQPEAAQRNHSHASRHWTLSSVAAIVLASFAFLIPAFLNGFPFLYPDSGDYLVLTPQLYRSPFYSLFLLFAHMNRFIWNAVLAQALVLSWLLFILCRLYSSRPVATFLHSWWPCSSHSRARPILQASSWRTS